MKNLAHKTSFINLLCNVFLFIAKLGAGIITNSLAIISDAINSFMDVVYSIVVFICVGVSSKKADKGHPFGHHRAEPIAGLIVAVLTGIVGFEIIRHAILNFISPKVVSFNLIGIVVLIVAILVKLYMTIHFNKIGKQIHSEAILASSIDSRNDVFASLIALLGFIGTWFNIFYLDSIAAVFISFFIFKTGFEVGMRNINYLMGKRPPQKIINKIKQKAKSVKGVKRIHNVRAHYVGTFVHVEVHIVVSKRLSSKKAHDIGEKVKSRVESLELVNKAFVHVDVEK